MRVGTLGGLTGLRSSFFALRNSCNARKHRRAPRDPGWLDPYSSARAFDGWRGVARDALTDLAPVALPRTWLLAIGWRRGGLIDPDHCPGAMPA